MMGQGPAALAQPNRPEYNSLPEFLDLILFGRTVLVVNAKFGCYWAIRS